MKKMLMALTIVLVSTQGRAFNDLQSTQNSILNPSKESFLDVAQELTSEYVYHDDGLMVEEYDQNVSDNVQPPKICPAKELLTRTIGSLLVHCLNLQNNAHLCFQEIKNAVSRWYTMVREII